MGHVHKLAIPSRGVVSGDERFLDNVIVEGDFTFGDAVTDTLTLTGVLNQGTDTTALVVESGTPLRTLYSSSTDTTGTVTTHLIKYEHGANTRANQTEVFVVELESNYETGDWANAIVARLDYASTGDAAGGMAAPLCSELNYAGKSYASAGGAYYVLDLEMNCPTSFSCGTNLSYPNAFINIAIWGASTPIGTWEDYGFLFRTDGFTAASGNIISANSLTARVRIESETKYLLMSEAEDCISLGTWGTPIVQSTSGDNLVKIYAQNSGTTDLTTQPLWVYSRLGYAGNTVSSVMSAVCAVEIKAGTTCNASANNQYVFGIQGRHITDGVLNNAGYGWNAGVAGEVRETSGTFTGYKYLAPLLGYSNIQSSVIGGGIYAGCIIANAGGQAYDYGFFLHEHASVGVGIVPQGTGKTMTSGFLLDATTTTVVTNAIELIDTTSISYALKTGTGGGCIITNTHAIDGHALQDLIRVELDGDVGYVPVFAGVPS